MRILIAEDDSILADGLVRSLRQSGYAVDHVKSGSEADAALSMQTFDLLILDLGLPRMRGLEVLRRLRARNSALPVLILTAVDSVDERVKGLDLGADDYMSKPFHLNELEARVRALTRRGSGGGPTVVRHGSLAYDQVGRVASVGDQVLELSARELGVLEVLLQRIGRLVSKEQLVDHLCEWGEEVSNNAIEVYVHRLRKKIEPSGVRIITVRGLGYCLERPVPGGAALGTGAPGASAAAIAAPATAVPSVTVPPFAGAGEVTTGLFRAGVRRNVGVRGRRHGHARDGRCRRRDCSGARPGRTRAQRRAAGHGPLQAVAEPAHRNDAHTARLDLLAQTVNVDLDRVVADFLSPFAEVIDELLFRDEPPDPLQQHFEHAELTRRQFEDLIAHRGDAPHLIVGQRAVAHDRGPAAAAAPRQGSHARLEFV
jgi:two-component system OmpR family response regulator